MVPSPFACLKPKLIYNYSNICPQNLNMGPQVPMLYMIPEILVAKARNELRLAYFSDHEDAIKEQ